MADLLKVRDAGELDHGGRAAEEHERVIPGGREVLLDHRLVHESLRIPAKIRCKVPHGDVERSVENVAHTSCQNYLKNTRLSPLIHRLKFECRILPVPIIITNGHVVYLK